MEATFDKTDAGNAERDRQDALETAHRAGWSALRESYPEYLADPDIVTAAFARFFDPVAAYQELELQIPLSTRSEVKRRLQAVRQGEWEKAFIKRAEHWRADLEKELGTPVQAINTFPEGLERPSHAFVDPCQPGALAAELVDGRRVLFQILASGHHFAADVYAATGAYLQGNHDYSWQEFREQFRI